MTKKFTVKQHKPSGKWAIYQREGNKTNKADDKLIRIIEHGLHTALAICETENRLAGRTDPLILEE